MVKARRQVVGSWCAAVVLANALIASLLVGLGSRAHSANGPTVSDLPGNTDVLSDVDPNVVCPADTTPARATSQTALFAVDLLRDAEVTFPGFNATASSPTFPISRAFVSETNQLGSFVADEVRARRFDYDPPVATIETYTPRPATASSTFGSA